MELDFDEDYYLTANFDVIFAIRSGTFGSAYEHFSLCGQREGRTGVPAEGQPAKGRRAHRAVTRQVLSGGGIEIGALSRPCPVPEGSHVTYVDQLDERGAREAFPELSRRDLQPVDVVVDLDRDALDRFGDASQDFVIFNHGLARLANPVRCMQQMLRVVRPEGHVVLSIWDKRHSYESGRALTSWDHVLDEYLRKTVEVTDVHYMDLVGFFYADQFARGVDALVPLLAWLRRSRERAHCWDGDSFREFVERSARLCDVDVEIVHEVTAEQTGWEYFAIVKKLG